MIIFIIPGLQDTSPIGWAVSLLLRLKDEVDVLVFCMDGDIHPSANRERLVSAGVEIIYGDGPGLFGFVWSFFRIRRVVRIRKPRLVISLLFRADLLLSLLGDRVPSVSSLRNMIDEEYTYSYGMFRGYVITQLHLAALRRIRHSVAMSTGMRVRLCQLGLKNVHLIPNGLDTRLIDCRIADSRKSAPKRNFPKIIVVGSLIRRKQVTELIIALWDLYQDGISFDIDVIGTGPEKERIIQFLRLTDSGFRSRVNLAGHVENTLERLGEADVFVMNSLSEGVSRALMEAMYMGVVVVVRRHHGSIDLIRDGITGYLYDTSEEMKGLLREFHLNPSSFRQPNLPSNFSMDDNARAYLRLIYEIQR